MPNAPSRLHIHPLHENESTNIFWDAVDDAVGYVLERSFNQTFEEAVRGLTWRNIDTKAKTWSQIESAALTWGQKENLSTLGLAWSTINNSGRTWSNIEALQKSWHELELLQYTNFEIYRGSGTEASGLTWIKLEDREVTWDEVEAKEKTWDCFKAVQLYRSTTDEISINAKLAIYRISSFSDTGIQSDFLTTGLIPVTPIFHREDHTAWQAEAGNYYAVLLEGSNLRDMHKIFLNMRYSSGTLQLEDFMAQIGNRQTAPGIYPDAHLRIHNHSPGDIRFHSTRLVPAGKRWSGGITWLMFAATRSGMADVRLF